MRGVLPVAAGAGVVNHYEILGVAPDAPLAAIRQAYLRCVLGGPAADPEQEARRQAASEAWTVLRSPERRAEYDASILEPATAIAPIGPPPLPDVLPVVPAEREPSRLLPDLPTRIEPAVREGMSAKFAALFPPAVVALSVVLLLVALVLGSGPVMLAALLLLVIGFTSYIIIPLFDIARGR